MTIDDGISRIRISVVIPCYNCADTISDTLDSIFDQSLRPIEVIAVNDGSSDDTLEVLNSYDGPVSVLTQKNSGVSRTRNRGVAEAKGDWIAFCDSDDTWEPNKLAVFAAFLGDQSDAQFVFHDFSTLLNGEIAAQQATESKNHSLFPIFRRGQFRMSDLLPDRRYVASECTLQGGFYVLSGNAFIGLLRGNFVQPSSMIVCRTLFEELGGFDEDYIHAEDTEFNFRLAKRAEFHYIDLPLLTYKVLSTSLLNTSVIPTAESGLRATLKHSANVGAGSLVDVALVNKLVAQRCARLAHIYVTELESVKARELSSLAISFYNKDPIVIAVWLFARIPPFIIQLARRLKSNLKPKQAFAGK